MITGLKEQVAGNWTNIRWAEAGLPKAISQRRHIINSRKQRGQGFSLNSSFVLNLSYVSMPWFPELKRQVDGTRWPH